MKKKNKKEKGTDVEIAVGNLANIKAKGASTKTIVILLIGLALLIFLFTFHYSSNTAPDGTKSTDIQLRKRTP